MAVIDVEIVRVDSRKLQTTHQHVMSKYGPSDPTIVVTVGRPDERDIELDMEELMEELDNYGNVVLVRFNDTS